LEDFAVERSDAFSEVFSRKDSLLNDFSIAYPDFSLGRVLLQTSTFVEETVPVRKSPE